MSASYIYTERNDCQDCYKCIRECPVKAIKIENQSASIIQENCIYCGHCTTVCPVEAKKPKEDISTAKYLLHNYEKVYVSLAPSWISEFPEFDKHTFITLLKRLGFFEVSETALGAEIVSGYITNNLKDKTRGVFISPCCPSSIELIHKYYPKYAKDIINVDTPMLAHGKFLREKYGRDIKIVFIGPCIAKKKEADMTPGIIDAVITFKHLKKWFDEQGIFNSGTALTETSDFVPFPANKGNLYPVTGGMIAGVRKKEISQKISFLSFSGVKTIIPILNVLDKLGKKSPVFLELLACTEGCINGPGTSHNNSTAVKRTMVLDNYDAYLHREQAAVLEANIHNPYAYAAPVILEKHNETEINGVLHSIGKQTKDDELNCGGCGYERCHDFANAILDGKAERKMCVSYMRRVAQDKASALLQRMPYGVVIVDKNLKVVESNRNFAELAGEEAVFAYEAKPGLEGADLTKLITFHKYFSNLFNSGEGVLEKDIRTGNQFIHLSIFTLEGRNLLCAILHNLRAPEISREEIVKRTRKVIRENLQTVQTIAFHLGENASKMETLLNSIVDIQDADYDE